MMGALRLVIRGTAGGPRAAAHSRLRGAVLAAALAGATAGCAAAPSDPAALADNNDPAEPVNRAIFDANMAVDRAVVKPVAEAYRDHLPAEVREGIHNAAANLNEPMVAVNDVLQGRFGRAVTSMQRFAVNTTAGIGGVVDRAKDLNLPRHSTDFGQTFATWGIGEGPFVELPVLGPSNLRDTVGTVAAFALNPLSHTGSAPVTDLGHARTAADFIDTRAAHLSDLEALERTSIDLYATLRSVSRQHRQAQIDKTKADDVAK